MDPAALASMPAALPPPGQLTNFVDPPSQQGAMIAVCTVMLILTLLFVSLRLYSSFCVTRSQGAEDYLCVVAMVLSFAYIGFVLHLSYVARHMWDVPELWFTEDYWKIRFAQNITQAFAFFTSRLPVFLLYLRLFGRNKVFRYAVYIGLAADFCVYLSAIPLLSYFCTPPIGQSWGSLDVFTKCKELVVYAVVQGSCNISLDLYIFLLPWPTIFGLHLPMKRKLGILAIFATGFLAVIASAISLYYRYQLSYGPDINWNEGAFIATASVEINIVIICSSMPACSSLAKNVSEKSGLLGSVRSFFDHYILSSAGKNSSKKSKYSYGPSYPAESKQSQRSTDDKIPLSENGYVELQETRPYTQRNEINATGRYHQSSRPKPYDSGIVRTVDVDIV
ncbi:hypothetical protein MMC34_007428 [Xylographa carneopallida]|nr:hypothetical protein [Xylographa carneopallida]